MAQTVRRKAKAAKEAYCEFNLINGEHPLKRRVPFAYVEYQARRRENGKVVFFNFRLAKEIGLIPDDHPHTMNRQLEEKLLDTFGLIIINEYDLLHQVKIPKKDRKPNTYMATRYLQLQHPNKRGVTSGDGRSIWNGFYEGKGRVWDITSCGTGATCLSPAHAKENRFFKSGDPSVSYGCGYANVDEGLMQVLFSEILHANEVPTERALAVIEFPNGFAVNVRAGMNLLRPSHFFNHLKQGHWLRLKSMVDFYVERETANKTWNPRLRQGKTVYDKMLEHLCETFARTSALFENEYIFCWMDWDGDNILANGGIIDYGSIRQFGLFHKDYRYDDVDRFSTSILEQKYKARYTVQTFVQMMDYVKTGRKKPIRKFQDHPILKKFDRYFKYYLYEYFLRRLGLKSGDRKFLLEHRFQLVEGLFRDFRFFESQVSHRGLKDLPDGIDSDVIFSMREVMRELPQHLKTSSRMMTDKEFIQVARSKCATARDMKLSENRKIRIKSLQTQYVSLVRAIAKKRNCKVETVCGMLYERSVVVNRQERITGDTIIQLTEKLMRLRGQFEPERFHRLVYELIDCMILNPEIVSQPYGALDQSSQDNIRMLKNYMRLVSDAREGI